MPGIFLTVEGGDGAGKSTQIQLLADWCADRGAEVVCTREPGGTPLGIRVRELLLHGEHVDEWAEALLYAADRAQHLAQVVRPALARGAIVIQDRYVDSSLAYQGAGRTLAEAQVRQINTWATGGLCPKLTVLLDIDPELAASRRAAADKPADRMERETHGFHRKVRESFLRLAAAEPERFLVLDAALPAATLHATITARVAQLLRR